MSTDDPARSTDADSPSSSDDDSHSPDLGVRFLMFTPHAFWVADRSHH
ncbi:MAG: hypothetical protein ACRDUW_01555 [Pseudonocardiaceae bacterium]